MPELEISLEDFMSLPTPATTGSFKTFYELNALDGKSPVEVADIIAAWREDDDQAFDAACDLLNAIERFLRDQPRA